MHPAKTITSFAKKVEQTLAARGAHVAIVARVGRDPTGLPDGIDYTHVAFRVFSRIHRADGSDHQVYRVYNLYQQGGEGRISKMVQDSPEELFSGLHTFDAGIIVPDFRLQKKLLDVITSPTYAELHNASHSMLANPRSLTFQNYTEHSLDVLMASLYGTNSKAQIKASITAHFDPLPVQIGGMKRVLAPASSPALTTVDHGSDVATAIFGSIARFMRSHGLDQGILRQTRHRIHALAI